MSLGGSKPALAGEQPQINALRFQTSTQGMVIPVVFGTGRLSGNLIWYGDFRRVVTKQQQGGVCGGVEMETTAYYASYLMGICEGPIETSLRVWKGREKVADLGWDYASLPWGFLPQDPLAWLLSAHPTEALAYPGLCYMGALNHPFGSTPNLPGLSFEIKGFLVETGLDDANPADIIYQIWTNLNWGLGQPSAFIDHTSLHEYCMAQGLLVSPVYDGQKSAATVFKELLEAANSDVILHDGTTLKFIPYGDASLSGNGSTWDPDDAAIYDLDDDDFLYGEDEDPITVIRKTPADAYNAIRLEVLERDNDYNPTVVEFKDQAAIDLYGYRPDNERQMHMICEPDTGKTLVQLMGQRGLYIRNEYRFRLGWKYCLLEPMDVVTLTDSALGMTLFPVRIIEIEENDEGELSVLAEDYPAGVGNITLYPDQATDPYNADFNVDPGNVNTPVIFSAPAELTVAGFEVWMAISGGDNWGGCDVYASMDDATYKWVGKQMGQARYGTLTDTFPVGLDFDLVNTLPVDLTPSKGELLSGSWADVTSLTTLCLIAQGTVSSGSILLENGDQLLLENDTPYGLEPVTDLGAYEVIAYRTATLTSAYHYNLTEIKRGVFKTNVAEHATGAAFVRLDSQIFRYVFDQSMLGKTIWLKFQSFNKYGVASQDLASVTAYPFILGSQLYWPDKASKYGKVGYYYNTHFQTLDEWNQSGTGTTTAGDGYVSLISGTAYGDLRTLSSRYRSEEPFQKPSWLKNKRMRVRVYFNSTLDSSQIRLFMGRNVLTENHVGFKIVNGRVYGSTANQTSETTVDLGVDVAQGGSHEFELAFFAGSSSPPFLKEASCQFYIDGVYRGKITETMPLPESGYVYWEAILNIINYGSDSVDKEIWVSEWESMQDP